MNQSHPLAKKPGVSLNSKPEATETAVSNTNKGPLRSIVAGVLAVEPFAVVFLASAITLIIEIIAARILAPHIGVSVYTWTSIIGVILAGISFGNWLGGIIADRAALKGLLGLILMAGAAITLLILPLAQTAPGWSLDLPILWRIVSLTAILFIVPATILAIVITLTLRDLSKTGKTVGRIYALSTAGAIVGVFLTGFLFIQWLGSRETILYLAITLAIIAIVSGRLWRSTWSQHQNLDDSYAHS